MACQDCNGNVMPSGLKGDNGWTPNLAVVDCGTNRVLRLIKWVGGTGIRPLFGTDEMTDTWLNNNPIYIGTTGLVTNCNIATNIKGDTGEAGGVGEDGDPGCNPDIELNISIGEGEESYEASVTKSGTTCAPVYDVNFPIESITDIINSEVNNIGFNDAPWVLITGTDTNGLFGLRDLNSNMSGISYQSAQSFVKYKLLGKTLILHFVVKFDFNVDSGLLVYNFRLGVKLPNNYLKVNVYNVGNFNAEVKRLTPTTATEDYTFTHSTIDISPGNFEWGPGNTLTGTTNQFFGTTNVGQQVAWGMTSTAEVFLRGNYIIEIQ